MKFPRLRTSLILLAAAGTLGACSYNDGYGYGGVSVGYGNAGYCDPYYYDCYSGYGRAGYGYGYADPWYGWYGNYYYPGIGIYVYDQGGRRHRWNDQHRRYWESRRQQYQGRNWNDRQWENWSGYRSRTQDGYRSRSQDGRTWRGRSQDDDGTWRRRRGG